MKNKTTTIITIILTVVILIGGVSAIAYYSNGFTTDVRTFDVLYNGKIIDNQTLVIKDDNVPMTLQVVSKLNNSIDVNNIKCTVVSNKNADNAYVHRKDGNDRLSTVVDFTELFNIEILDDKIHIATDWNIEKFLTKHYETDEVKLLEFEHYKQSYFDIVITIDKSVARCNIVDYITAKNIEIDKDNIIFGGDENAENVT